MNQIFRDASPYHGFLGQPETPEQLKAIVEAAVLTEREACAKACDDIGDSDNGYGCAAAIRSRGNNA